MLLKKSLIPTGAWPRAALLLVTLETICVLTLEALVLHQHVVWIVEPALGNALSIPKVIYPCLYMLGIVCLFVLCVDAMYNRNQIQVVAFTIFNFLCFAYGVIQTLYDWKAEGGGVALKAFDIAVAVTTGISSVFLAFTAWKLAAVFGWEMYRFLGADIKMRKMHKGYEILITLLKFDVFFFVAFAVQLFTLVDPVDKTIIATLPDGRGLSRTQVFVGLGIPASILLLALSFLGVMRENKPVTIFVMVCLAAVEPYFIYQMVSLNLAENRDRYRNSMKYLTFFVAVTFVLVLVTLFFMIYCFRNYGKGLLICDKSKNTAAPKRPFEIDEDVSESVPMVKAYGHQEQGGAYPSLKKIQDSYKNQSRPQHASQPQHHQQYQGQGNNYSRRVSESSEKSYDDKMEIE